MNTIKEFIKFLKKEEKSAKRPTIATLVAIFFFTLTMMSLFFILAFYFRGFPLGLDASVPTLFLFLLWYGNCPYSDK